MSVRQLILVIYLCLFAALGVASGLYFVRTRDEYNRLKAIEAQNRRRLDETEKKLAEQRKTLDRLRNDPAYVEMIIRRNLHYSKSDEAVFQFDQ